MARKSSSKKVIGVKKGATKGTKNKGSKKVVAKSKSVALVKKTAKKVTAKKSKSTKIQKKQAAPVKKKKVIEAKQKSAKTNKVVEKVESKSVRVEKPLKKIAKKQGRIDKIKALKNEVRSEPTLQESIATMPVAPSPKALKTFRQITKDNRKLQATREKARKKRDGFIAKPPKTGKNFKVDLRVHSPGTVGFFTMGGVETASALVRLAKVKGLDIVGITDYYNGIAIDEVKEIAQQSGLTVIPGVDLVCKVGLCEEVHLSALFPETFRSTDIFSLLDVLNVPPHLYGRQDYCLETPLPQVLEEVESRGGIVIPTRLDKTPHRQLAIRPLVEQFGFHAFDVVYPDNLECFRDWPEGQFTFVGFSNAYSLGQVGSRTEKMRLTAPTFEAIKERFQRRKLEEQKAN